MLLFSEAARLGKPSFGHLVSTLLSTECFLLLLVIFFFFFFFFSALEILWLVVNDFCAEQLRDRLEFVFSPDIIPSGWLGSKHQLTNWQIFFLFYSIFCTGTITTSLCLVLKPPPLPPSPPSSSSFPSFASQVSDLNHGVCAFSVQNPSPPKSQRPLRKHCLVCFLLPPHAVVCTTT